MGIISFTLNVMELVFGECLPFLSLLLAIENENKELWCRWSRNHILMWYLASLYLNTTVMKISIEILGAIIMTLKTLLWTLKNYNYRMSIILPLFLA